MGVFDKMKDLIGIEEIDDEEISEEEIREVGRQIDTKPEQRQAASKSREREPLRDKVVPLQANKSTNPFKLMITEPEGFDECPKLVDLLRARKPVIINLEKMDVDTARKIFDFLSGATYALGGTVQPIANNIFIFAPENVDITASTQNASFDFGDSSKKVWR